MRVTPNLSLSITLRTFHKFTPPGEHQVDQVGLIISKQRPEPQITRKNHQQELYSLVDSVIHYEDANSIYCLFTKKNILSKHSNPLNSRNCRLTDERHLYITYQDKQKS